MPALFLLAHTYDPVTWNFPDVVGCSLAVHQSLNDGLGDKLTMALPDGQAPVTEAWTKKKVWAWVRPRLLHDLPPGHLPWPLELPGYRDWLGHLCFQLQLVPALDEAPVKLEAVTASYSHDPDDDHLGQEKQEGLCILICEDFLRNRK